MTDVQAPPLNQIPPQASPTDPDDDETQPAAPNEPATETLYIQNLNEKIKVDGQHTPTRAHSSHLTTSGNSAQNILARPFQIIWRSSGCRRPQ